MRTRKEHDDVLLAAHRLEIALSVINSEELAYDETIFVALRTVMDGLDIPKSRKVCYLDRVIALYI